MIPMIPDATLYVVEEDAWETICGPEGPEQHLTLTAPNERVAAALHLLDSEFDALSCEAPGCQGNPVGFYLWEDEDTYGRPFMRVRYGLTVIVDDGTRAHLCCEECAAPPLFPASPV